MSGNSNPNSIDFDLFEQVIIFNCLFPQHAAEYSAAVIDHLKPELFKNKAAKMIIGLIRDFYDANQKIITITELKLKLVTAEQKELCKQLFATFNSINEAYHMPELMKNTELYIRNRLLAQAIDGAILQHQESKQFDISSIMTQMDEVHAISLVDDLGLDYFKDFDKYCEDLQVVNTYLSTGWSWLDEKLGGGLLENGKAIYVFCGTTNVGKSIFLSNMAANILKQGKTVVVITLEMSQQVYASRITAQLWDIGIGNLAQNIELLKRNNRGLKEANFDGDLIIKEFPPASISSRTISGYLKKLQRRGIKPDAIIVDYLSLLIPNNKAAGNSYMDVKKVSEELRALSYIFECPIVTASQLNRTAYGKENPGLDTISESMGLAHTADVQIAIWCNDEEKKAGIINMGMMKNRFGPNFGSTAVSINWSTLKLTEIAPMATPNQHVDEEVAQSVSDVEKMLIENQFS